MLCFRKLVEGFGYTCDILRFPFKTIRTTSVGFLGFLFFLARELLGKGYCH